MIKNKRLATFLVLLAIGWVGLFYSARAVLVWQWTNEADDRLSCYYVAATGPFKRTHMHSESGVFGRAECPRVLKLN
jgi:hypothetical protein